MTTVRTPFEVDTDLAAAHGVLGKALQNMKYADSSAQYAFGDRVKGFGGTRFTTTAKQAWERVQAAADNGDEHLRMGMGRPSELLAKRAERVKAVEAAFDAIYKLDEEYRGWSRFYLVTSSPGHVHSSMVCHSCRPTTTYGWRPELSGKSTQEALADVGPTLCKFCFPALRPDQTRGKISKAQAAELTA